MKTITIDVPVSRGTGLVPKSDDFIFSDGARQGLTDLRNALHEIGARLADGGAVTTHHHAINWILESIAASADKAA